MNGVRIDPFDGLIAEKLKNAAAAELQAAELALNSASAPPDLGDYQKSFDQAAGQSIPILSLVSSQYTLTDLVSADLSRAGAAVSEFLALLSLAANLPNEPVTIIPAGRTAPDCDYELAFHHVFQKIRNLVRHAESLSVRFAIENPPAGLLLSPLEMRDLLDALNSPFLGACLNLDHAERFSRASDWLKILDRRIFAIHYITPPPPPLRETLRIFTARHAPLPVIHIA